MPVYYDVSCTHPHAVRRGHRYCRTHQGAVEKRAKEKHRHYRPGPGQHAVNMVPLIYTTYGGWDQRA
eukprot:7182634-Prorocentrum_lima.AAC.1